jgi:D-tyrosyl-tRNA(Tyr) deacylase
MVDRRQRFHPAALCLVGLLLAGPAVAQTVLGRVAGSVLDASGGLLVVSQFTLLGDVRKGRRPSYSDAATPEEANRLYEHFVSRVRPSGLAVATGVFRAMMDVALVNEGPVTLLLDSRRQF